MLFVVWYGNERASFFIVLKGDNVFIREGKARR